MRTRRAAPTLLAFCLSVGLPACQEPTPPEATTCNTTGRVSVCLTRATYPTPGQITFTVSTWGEGQLFLDYCSGGVTNDAHSGGSFRGCRRPRSTRQDILDNMVPIPRSGLLLDSIPLYNHLDADWWVEVNVLDARGERIPGSPFLSPTFRTTLTRPPEQG